MDRESTVKEAAESQTTKAANEPRKQSPKEGKELPRRREHKRTRRGSQKQTTHSRENRHKTEEESNNHTPAQASRSRVRIRSSVIIAVQDVGGEVRGMYNALLSSLGRNRPNYELIFVDDGSLDDTWRQLKGIAKNDKRVKLIRMRKSFGEAAAFDAGFKRAKGQNIAFLASRVRINPKQINALLAKLDDGFDVVMGWRYPRRDSGLNQFISKIFNVIVRWISKNRLQDNNSGVFAARREVLNDVPMYGNFNIFLPILAERKGYAVSDEKIEQLPGKFRQSRYFLEYIHRMLDIVTVFFLTNYSKKPLHFLGFIGMCFTLVGAAMNLYLFLYRLLQFGPIAGRPLLLLGAMLFVIGIQMISIGLIGEMIIFTHAKEIKEYTIEEVLD